MTEPVDTCVTCGHSEMDHDAVYENRPRKCAPLPGERWCGCDCADFVSLRDAESAIDAAEEATDAAEARQEHLCDQAREDRLFIRE